MNIKENNKLLAEFMGCYQNNEGFWGFENTPNHKTWNNDRFLDCTKYDTDWNWLMEVVEKIESLTYKGFNIYVDITTLTFIHTEESNLEIAEVFGGTKIENTYNACVQFVQWYNNQNE